MKKHIYQGSVKDIYQLDDRIEFHFSDRYSIYDWGEMPDQIPHKGKYLNQIATFFFDYLNNPITFQEIDIPDFLNAKKFKDLFVSESYQLLLKQGQKNHFIEQTNENCFSAKEFKVHRPHYIHSNYDYSSYSIREENTLIPLEVVFRFGTPIGSSLLRRDYKTFKEEQNINTPIMAGAYFDNIAVEFYTKLEPTDRLLSNREAKIISGLSQVEFENLVIHTKILALVLFNKFQANGFKLWDGKFEFATGQYQNGEREIILIDSIGPDELRLTRNEIPFSKEILRQFYQDSKWLQEFKIAKKRDFFNFKNLTHSRPEKLAQNKIKLAAYIYECIAISLKENKSFRSDVLETELKNNFKQIVIFGKGGREHALAKRLANESSVQLVYVIPGNAGMNDNKIIPTSIDPKDYIQFCRDKYIDLAVIGPEDLLTAGLADELKHAGISTFAPSKIAAKLEGSKAFAKNLMQKYSIPTAEFKNFTHEYDAHCFIRKSDWPKFVVKQSSLAAGKGVIICDSKEEAIIASSELLKRDETIVIEEFLEGKEVSFFAICLDQQYKILGHACDYKRLKTNNLGPNTGGMGCYAPAYWLTDKDIHNIEQDVLIPTLKAMHREDASFKGTLFIGIMMTQFGPKVLEYNVRFGDPETQTLMPLIKDGFLETLMAVAMEDEETFTKAKLELAIETSVHVVKASKGYPGMFGQEIELDKTIDNNFVPNEKLHLFFAGVKSEQDKLKTSGGRVLGITSIHKDLETARNIAYESLTTIGFEGEQFREDIGL